MKRIANKDARQYVESKTPFTGSNMFAETVETQNTCVYVVYSYGAHFPMYIAEWEKGTNPDTALWYRNVDKYYVGGKVSQSTERQKSQARPFNIDYQFSEMTTEAMRVMAVHGIAGLVVYGRAA